MLDKQNFFCCLINTLGKSLLKNKTITEVITQEKNSHFLKKI